MQFCIKPHILYIITNYNCNKKNNLKQILNFHFILPVEHNFTNSLPNDEAIIVGLKCIGANNFIEMLSVANKIFFFFYVEFINLCMHNSKYLYYFLSWESIGLGTFYVPQNLCFRRLKHMWWRLSNFLASNNKEKNRIWSSSAQKAEYWGRGR